MAVIVQYIVERNGVQKMTFTDKKEADQYDKMLDIAETLYDYIDAANLPLSEESLEPLSLFLAENSVEIGNLLKGSKPKKPKAARPSKDEASKDNAADESADNDLSTITADTVESLENFDTDVSAESDKKEVEVA